ncbi:hypothetical protein O181_103728 [Austropuccinia psidii MF-1]|uniref:Uncharacterized protein n=1 Tax=Austropuccinia psidii MF-1 TaxID=1389203 RepID=A0A9Q3JKV9_9BASI|nr:hypothetical protein [Austropuccinia psidii MF-1]
MESQQKVQTPGEKGSQDKGESSHYTSHRRATGPERAYSDSFRITKSKQTRLPSGFTPFRNWQISYQEPPFITISGNFQEKTRIKGEKQDFF